MDEQSAGIAYDIFVLTFRGEALERPRVPTPVDYFGDLNYLNIPIIMPGYSVSRVLTPCANCTKQTRFVGRSKLPVRTYIITRPSSGCSWTA